jgi:hypothetical protein
MPKSPVPRSSIEAGSGTGARFAWAFDVYVAVALVLAMVNVVRVVIPNGGAPVTPRIPSGELQALERPAASVQPFEPGDTEPAGGKPATFASENHPWKAMFTAPGPFEEVADIVVLKV